jgi:hypothetical protein
MSDMVFANYLLSSITLTDGGEATGSCYHQRKNILDNMKLMEIVLNV